MNAEFKVIKIDINGSGADYDDYHLGLTLTNGRRCCKYCPCIYGDIFIKGREYIKFGPFILGELEPLNDAAHNLLQEIKSFPERKALP